MTSSVSALVAAAQIDASWAVEDTVYFLMNCTTFEFNPSIVRISAFSITNGR